MKPFVEEIDIQPEDAALALHALPYSLWLDSADIAHPSVRYSYIVTHPVEMIEAKNGRVTVTNMAQQTVLEGDIFKILQDRLAAWNGDFEIVPDLPPFQGGLAGFFGYDLARTMERLPDLTPENPSMPDMALGIYDQVIAFDHYENKAWIITRTSSERDAKLKRARVLNIIRNHSRALQPAPALRWSARQAAEEYKDKVQTVVDFIRAGDIFQANLSQRFDAVLPPGFDSFSHYMTLRDINPAPYAAYMNFGRVVISSASPEQFLGVRDGIATTRPIKGTRPRGQTRDEDARQKAELLNSVKDRAENVMIVDLLRNDLSKACTPDSVEVETLCGLESFAGVHHLVSTVKGKLRKPTLELLKGCFPGGSITGAPKIRAMEILASLEPVRRGAYCGSAAWIGFDGTMDSSILIRTLVYEGNKVSLQAGGGITAESDPEEEYRETLAKAEKIFRSFEPQKVRKTA